MKWSIFQYDLTMWCESCAVYSYAVLELLLCYHQMHINSILRQSLSQSVTHSVQWMCVWKRRKSECMPVPCLLLMMLLLNDDEYRLVGWMVRSRWSRWCPIREGWRLLCEHNKKYLHSIHFSLTIFCSTCILNIAFSFRTTQIK